MKISESKIKKYEHLIKQKKQRSAKASCAWKIIGIIFLFLLSVLSIVCGIYGICVIGPVVIIALIWAILFGFLGLFVCGWCIMKTNNTYWNTINKINLMTKEDLAFEIELLLK